MGSNAYTLTQGAAAFSSPAFSFTRNVTTVDDYGVQVAANVPRFGKPVAVAGQLGPAEDVLTGMGSDPNIFGGKDVDGRTLLVAIDTNGSDRRVRVMTEASANVWTTQQNFNLGKATSGAGLGGAGDIRRIVGTAGDDGLCFIAKAWTILHGSLIAFCEVRVRTSGSGTVWDASEVRGCGFAVSNDYGATWEYTYEDTAENFNPGAARLSGWSMCGYYAPFQTAGDPFTEAWICACDYQTAGNPPATAPHGGTVYWFRLTRSATTDRFVPINTSGTITTGRDNLNVTSVNDSLKYSQRQGVGLAKDPNNTDKLIVLIAESDGRWSSITKLSNIDRTDYANPGYTTTKNWHGFRDTSVELNSGHSTFTGSMTSGSGVISLASLGATWGNKLAPYNSLNGTVIRVAGAGAAGADLIATVTAFNEGAATITLNANASTIVAGATCTIQIRGDYATGNQFVAACQGPEDGEIIVGGDAAVGSMDVIQSGDTRCTHRRLWGGHTDQRSTNDATIFNGDFPAWSCHRTFIAQLKVDAPELSTRTIVATLDRRTQMSDTAGPAPANIDTLLISRDSGRTWASMRWPDTSTVYTPNSTGLHFANEYLYTFSDGTSSIKRYRLPGVTSGRPFLVSPGTTNHMRDNFGGTNGIYDGDTPNNAIRCPKVGGKFQRVAMTGDGSGQAEGTALGDLDPQPPIWHDTNDANSGNVYRFRTGTLTAGTALPLANASNTFANFPICTRGNDSEFSGTIGMGAALSTGDYYKVRAFMLNASNLAESSTIARGKAPCNSFAQLRSNPYGGGALAFTGPTFQQCSNDEWDAIRITREVTGGPWNTNAAGGSAMLLQLLQGSGLDRVENDCYVAFDQFSPGKGSYGYPQPRGVAGATSANVVVVPAVNPNEVAELTGFTLGGGRSFTFTAIGVVPIGEWDHFTYRNATDTEWPILTLWSDANTYVTFAPSPWCTTVSSNVIDREGRLRITVNDGGTPTVKEQTGATFLSRESVTVVVRYDATTGTVTLDTVIAGQRMSTQTYAASAWTGKLFSKAKFSNADGTVVGSFAWISASGVNRLLTDEQIDTQLNTLTISTAGGGAMRLLLQEEDDE